MRNIEPETATVVRSRRNSKSKLSPDRFQFKNIPAIEFSDGRFTVKIAGNTEEAEAALRLRFQVFNVEFGKDPGNSFGIDIDKYDPTSHHLIVIKNDTREVVGVYRLRTLELAKTADQFYSANEFKIQDLSPEVLARAIEIGRASIAKSFRHKHVLFLLWKGLAEYIKATNKRYVFGCCSLFSQDYAEGQSTFYKLKKENHLCENNFVSGQKAFDFTDEEKLAGEINKDIELPQLFRLYLRIGARVCSPPIIDRKFGTIDFLVVFDVENLDRRYRMIFFGDQI
jgi:putative hemolysin